MFELITGILEGVAQLFAFITRKQDSGPEAIAKKNAAQKKQ